MPEPDLKMTTEPDKTVVKAEEQVDPVKLESPTAKQIKKDQLQNQINEILMEFKQIESDIPLNHEYWVLCNQLRGMK